MAAASIQIPADKKQLIADFKKSMQGLYGDRLSNIILYGSYARGEARPDSDIDFLVVLNDAKISTGHEIDRITDCVYSLMLQHKIDISFLPVSRVRFEKEQNPLFFFVRKDGIEA